METRYALATLRHLIRQASHVLWHVCGTDSHQDRPVSSVKDEMELDKMELDNIQYRSFAMLPSKAALVNPLLHLACTLLYTAIESYRTLECSHYG